MRKASSSRRAVVELGRQAEHAGGDDPAQPLEEPRLRRVVRHERARHERARVVGGQQHAADDGVLDAVGDVAGGQLRRVDSGVEPAKAASQRLEARVEGQVRVEGVHRRSFLQGSESVADQASAHRGAGLQRCRYRGMVEVGDVLEDHGLPLPLGQVGDALPQVGVGQRLLRPGSDLADRSEVTDGIAGHGAAPPGPVGVHRTPVGDGEQPAAQVPRRLQSGVGRQGLGPRLLRDVVTVHRAGERVGETGDVAPVRVHEGLEGGQAHPHGTARPPGV